ncbi:MAG: phosphatase PAP2 family protein [Chloroflexi bacterium]|nr:phosphatase PAP2 family protein [Chloroflexota bacterium]
MRARSVISAIAFWMASILLAAGFATLAIWSTREYYLPGDRYVTFRVQELYRYGWADGFFERAHQAGDMLVLSIALAALIGVLAVRRLFLEAAIVVAAGLSQFVQAGVSAAVQRPEGQYLAMRASFDGLLHPRIYPSPGGFPSGHVFGEVLAYGLVFWLAGRVLPWPLALPLRLACVAVISAGFAAPLYLGAHWFTDALGGALLALLVVLLSWRAERLLRRTHDVVRIEDLVTDSRDPAELVPAHQRPAGQEALRG